MYVTLNEKSFEDRDDAVDIVNVISFLDENISILNDKNIKIFTDFSFIETWIDEWKISTQVSSLLYKTIDKIQKHKSSSNGHYYYYFTHQDFNISVSENISKSSLAHIADCVLENKLAVVLNIPISYYCKRPYIPILKSSYDSKLKETLANVPSFNDSRKIVIFYLLNEKLKPFFKDAMEFQEFVKNYNVFYENFDFNEWKPKTYGVESKLNAAISFPASSNHFINDVLKNIKISVGSGYDENVAKYKELGGLILELHGYTKNKKLSSHYKYEIYEAGIDDDKLLVSIDTENGLFEVIENSGTHIGVYNYSGECKKQYTKAKDINSHSLSDIPKNMFLF